MKTFTLSIVTPGRKLLEEKVVSATLPTEAGEVTILSDHIPYIASLKPGEAVVRNTKGEERHMVILGGFAEFHGGELSILADAAEHAHEVDIEQAEAAVRFAEEIRLQKREASREDQEAAAAVLERAWAKLRIGRKHRTRRSIHPETSE